MQIKRTLYESQVGLLFLSMSIYWKGNIIEKKYLQMYIIFYIMQSLGQIKNKCVSGNRSE